MSRREPAARWACDTSVAVAALDPNHQAHGPCHQSVMQHHPALAGHAAFEAYAVLTRLPVPLRLTGPQAADVLARTFPDPCWMDSEIQAGVLSRVGAMGIVGGSLHDALVGLAASANRRALLTRDRRAERTYQALEVRYQLVE